MGDFLIPTNFLKYFKKYLKLLNKLVKFVAKWM